MMEFVRIVGSPLSPVMIVEDSYGGGSQISVGLRRLNVHLPVKNSHTDFYQDDFWIEHQVKRYFDAGGTHCIFVINRWDDAFRSSFKKLKTEHENVSFVLHPFPEKGILAAIQAGFSHLKLQNHLLQKNCWILPIDIPAPLKGVWQQLEHATQFHPHFEMIQPSHLGKTGFPVLLSEAAIQNLELNVDYQSISSIFELQTLCNQYECFQVKVNDPQVIEKIRKSENWDNYLVRYLKTGQATGQKFSYLTSSFNQ